MAQKDHAVFDADGVLLGVIYDLGTQYEAWARHRLRTGDIPGNAHRRLGTFNTYDEASQAVEKEERWTLPHGHVICPQCNGAERDSNYEDCKLCNGQGYVAESALT